MKPEWKAKLIEALESGRYTRALGTFRVEGDCMCVEGVLLDISGLGAWNEHRGYGFRTDKGIQWEGGYISHPFLLETFGLTRGESSRLYNVSDSRPAHEGWDHVLEFLKSGQI